MKENAVYSCNAGKKVPRLYELAGNAKSAYNCSAEKIVSFSVIPLNYTGPTAVGWELLRRALEVFQSTMVSVVTFFSYVMK